MEVKLCAVRSYRIGGIKRMVIEGSSTARSANAAQASALLLG
jgi:hypothetical protein